MLANFSHTSITDPGLHTAISAMLRYCSPNPKNTYTCAFYYYMLSINTKQHPYVGDGL